MPHSCLPLSSLPSRFTLPMILQKQFPRSSEEHCSLQLCKVQGEQRPTSSRVPHSLGRHVPLAWAQACPAPPPAPWSRCGLSLMLRIFTMTSGELLRHGQGSCGGATGGCHTSKVLLTTTCGTLECWLPHCPSPAARPEESPGPSDNRGTQKQQPQLREGPGTQQRLESEEGGEGQWAEARPRPRQS